MLFTGTITLGCKSYLDAQARSCYCPSQTGSSSTKGEDNTRNKKRYKESSNNRGAQENSKQKAPSYGWKDPSDM